VRHDFIAYPEAMLANTNQDVVDFLKANHIAVLATASPQSAEPHAATIFYATDSHMNLYFLTKEQTTKSKNLKSNPHAAIVIYNAETLRTAQITGSVSIVQNEEMMQKALNLMSRFSNQAAGTNTTPISKLDAGDYILYRLEPQSIRLGDYKYGSQGTIFEIATPAEESLDNL
jgi:nitroimidazol reductase NimA-like FMN-containing flavoprotein (pyridoxamine 5'-phosphate oxidase superfamily)